MIEDNELYDIYIEYINGDKERINVSGSQLDRLYEGYRNNKNYWNFTNDRCGDVLINLNAIRQVTSYKVYR